MYQKWHRNCREGRDSISFMGSGGTDSELTILVCMWDPGWVCSETEGTNGIHGLMLMKKLRSQESFWCDWVLTQRNAHPDQWSLLFLLLEKHFLGNIYLWKTFIHHVSLQAILFCHFLLMTLFLKPSLQIPTLIYIWGKKKMLMFHIKCLLIVIFITMIWLLSKWLGNP